jgi:hypothetical protein
MKARLHCDCKASEPRALTDQFEWLASDDATTCHIVALRNTATHCTALAHLDGFGDDFGSICCHVERRPHESRDRRTRRRARRDARRGSRSTRLCCLNAPPIDVYVVGGYNDERGISRRIAGTLARALHELPARFRVRLYCSMEGNSRHSSCRRARVSIPRTRRRRADLFAARHLARCLPAHRRGDDARAHRAIAERRRCAALSVAPQRRVCERARASAARAHAIQVLDRFRGVWCIPPLRVTHAKKRNLAHCTRTSTFASRCRPRRWRSARRLRRRCATRCNFSTTIPIGARRFHGEKSRLFDIANRN